MTTFNLTNRSSLFKVSVDKLFNNWTALQLAVANGQGGAYGKDIAIWMRGAVEDFFYENDNLMGEEVADFLGTIMNQELDTIVDDNSLDEIGSGLCHHFRLAMDHKDSELVELHSALDLANAATKSKPLAHTAGGGSSSEGSDEEMDTEDSHVVNGSDLDTSGRGTSHRTGHNFVTEPDDDGWVTVVKPKKH